jgi:hypothetical protein
MLRQEMEYHTRSKLSFAACAHKAKTTECKKKRLYIYQRAAPSLSFCSAWPWIKLVQFSKFAKMSHALGPHTGLDIFRFALYVPSENLKMYETNHKS